MLVETILNTETRKKVQIKGRKFFQKKDNHIKNPVTKNSLQTEFVDNDNKQANRSEAKCNSEETKSSLRREKMCCDKKLKNNRDESSTTNVNAIFNSSHSIFTAKMPKVNKNFGWEFSKIRA